jgi:serine beta-lactamase-like protein LACTB, mitochondrial
MSHDSPDRSPRPRAAAARRVGPAVAVLGALALAVLGAPAPAAAQPAAAAPEPTAAERVTALVEDLLEVTALPSFSVAILEDGEIAYAHARGFADLAAQRPAGAATRYRAASVSKVLTATLLGRLAQQKRIDLDVPLAELVPGFPDADGITPRLLAGHLAGIGHYQGQDEIDRAHHYASLAEALGTFRDSPRAGAPREAYHYSTHGYTLLAAAMEGATGESFLELLRREVFEPLGMTSTGPELRASARPEDAALYNLVARQPFPLPKPEDPSYKWAGGGLVSTPSDLVRLARGYLDGRFLEPAIVEAMWTPQRTAGGEETGVGIGWRIQDEPGGRRLVHHAGSMEGARSVVMILPDEDRAIATTTNSMWASSVEGNALLLLDAWIETPTDAPPEERGEWTVRGELIGTALEGTLSLGARRGELRSDAKTWPPRLRLRATDTLPLRRVGDRWVAVTSWGLAPFELERDEEGARGRLAISSQMQWSFTATPVGAETPEVPADAVDAVSGAGGS